MLFILIRHQGLGSRVSGVSIQENLSDDKKISSIVQEIKDNSEQEEILIKNRREEMYSEFIETELLIGLNSGPCKRAKKTGVSGFSLLIKKPCLSDRYSIKEVSSHEAVSNSMKDIDLELRLG